MGSIDMSETIRQTSLRDFLNIFFRHQAKILTVFAVTIISVIIGVYLWPETYEAKADILVKVGRENISVPTGVSQQQVVTALNLRKEDINSEIEILNNEFIIEKVVKELGADFLFPTPERPKTFIKLVKHGFKQAYRKTKEYAYEVLYFLDLKKRLTLEQSAVFVLKARLEATQVRNSDVIEVKLLWFDPNIAKVAVDTLVRFYREHHLEVHQTTGEYAFLQKQVDSIEKELKNSENRLHSIKKKQGITSYQEQVRFFLEQITTFMAQLKNTQTELAETRMRVKELQNQLASQRENVQLTKEVDRNPLLDQLKSRLMELELEKEKLKRKYNEESRPVAAVNEEIRRVQSSLTNEEASVTGRVTTGVNSIYRDISNNLVLQKVQLNALTEKNKELQRHIDTYQKELKKLNSYDVELKRLSREIRIDEENYGLYKRKLEEMRISSYMDKEKFVSVRVINPAFALFTPVRPRKMLSIGLGAALGLFAGVVLAFAAEFLDHSIKTQEDIRQYLGLPMLASIREEK